jgi:hypothetical protein
MAAVTFSLEEKLHFRAKAYAEKERRSLSQQIAYWIEREIEKETPLEAASVEAADAQ